MKGKENTPNNSEKKSGSLFSHLIKKWGDRIKKLGETYREMRASVKSMPNEHTDVIGETGTQSWSQGFDLTPQREETSLQEYKEFITDKLLTFFDESAIVQELVQELPATVRVKSSDSRDLDGKIELETVYWIEDFSCRIFDIVSEMNADINSWLYDMAKKYLDEDKDYLFNEIETIDFSDEQKRKMIVIILTMANLFSGMLDYKDEPNQKIHSVTLDQFNNLLQAGFEDIPDLDSALEIMKTYDIAKKSGTNYRKLFNNFFK